MGWDGRRGVTASQDERLFQLHSNPVFPLGHSTSGSNLPRFRQTGIPGFRPAPSLLGGGGRAARRRKEEEEEAGLKEGRRE